MYADIPYQTKTETLKDDCYVVILETHIGSKLLENEFTNFIEWLNAFNVSEVDKKLLRK